MTEELVRPSRGWAVGAQPLSPVPTIRCAPLVTRRDLSRQYAELIDVPIADEHLDRGCHSLIAAGSLGAMSLLESQAFKRVLRLGGRRIVIISHVTRPPHNAGC
jgi:hypothetical protein